MHDYVKQLCKNKKIPVYKLEKDLDFSHGSIALLKGDFIREERLMLLSNYFKIPTDAFLDNDKNENRVIEKRLTKKEYQIISHYYDLSIDKRLIIDSMLNL